MLNFTNYIPKKINIDFLNVEIIGVLLLIAQPS